MPWVMRNGILYKKNYKTAKKVELSGNRPFSCHVNAFSVFSDQNGLLCLVVYENFWLPEHVRGWWSVSLWHCLVHHLGGVPSAPKYPVRLRHEDVSTKLEIILNFFLADPKALLTLPVASDGQCKFPCGNNAIYQWL